MKWLEISLTLEGELAEPVADLLRNEASAGVAIEFVGEHTQDALAENLVTLRAYLPDDDELARKRERIEKGLWFLGRIRALPQAAYRFLEEEQWAEAWKAHYHPIPVGKRLLIQPAWLPPPPGDRLALSIDPGMAFGTGLHPTTRLCLAAIEEYLIPGEDFVDLGCGSGILSIAAAKLGASQVLALDIDPVAVEATRENAARNGLTHTIQAKKGSLPELREHLQRQGRRPHLVTANILADVLSEMLRSGLASAVRPGGAVILSGVLAEQSVNLAEIGSEQGLALVQTYQEGDWVTQVMKS